MLHKTFTHLPNIGSSRERKMWAKGISDWNALLLSIETGATLGRLAIDAVPILLQSLAAVRDRNVQFFELLPSADTWRLYTEFSKSALFLDIETTGMGRYNGEVTVIGAFGGGEPALFIRGINLHLFPDYVARFPLFVTYNGTLFDIPFLQASFSDARLNQPNIDLRYIFASLGFKGGVKGIESTLGYQRAPAVHPIDGVDTIHLWRQWCNGDKSALFLLARYNLTDVMQLVRLVESAVTMKLDQLSLSGSPCRLIDPPDDASLAAWTLQQFATL